MLMIHPQVARRLRHLSHRYRTEVQAWGRSSANPLFIEDATLLPSFATLAGVEATDSKTLAAYFSTHCDEPIDQWGRVAIHTQPGNAHPSGQDYTTFKEQCAYQNMLAELSGKFRPWLIMAILCEDSATATIGFYIGRSFIAAPIPVGVCLPTSDDELLEWEAEYEQLVKPPPPPMGLVKRWEPRVYSPDTHSTVSESTSGHTRLPKAQRKRINHILSGKDLDKYRSPNGQLDWDAILEDSANPTTVEVHRAAKT